MRPADRAEARAAQDRRAGVASRLLASAVDLVAAVLIALVALLVVSAVRGLFSRGFEVVDVPQPARGIVAGVLLVAYLGYGWGLEGRTLGKVVMGLRVVGSDGSDLGPGRGLLRALLAVLVPVGLLWALVSRRNASLHDVVLRTAVVHDWALPPPPPHARTPQG
jgi:uncharacterized RDD family membrane protein YckC